ncbi:hypothetical protein FIBSPDRAFT_862251 [Athelia psychrophila]|uniref:Uncharacterized protein n=1 Tax=Athelia psychrophila TaxID=1759441 RepID=A0A166IMP4_9AGAM|nr:hypothetical protein FIBSPDRAFT_862241 [Fibularhizoctonia sp. CBS 109695]KZP19998.1 hypothetical protein FIBSPDRAFT_862251 [Fibularhizoctonia sp. CBS 109695]
MPKAPDLLISHSPASYLPYEWVPFLPDGTRILQPKSLLRCYFYLPLTFDVVWIILKV